MLSGIKCHVCGIALEAPEYLKITDHWGNVESVYWANPKLSPYTDVRLNFCGAQHSLDWYISVTKKDEPGVAAHDNDPEQSQPKP